MKTFDFSIEGLIGIEALGVLLFATLASVMIIERLVFFWRHRCRARRVEFWWHQLDASNVEQKGKYWPRAVRKSPLYSQLRVFLDHREAPSEVRQRRCENCVMSWVCRARSNVRHLGTLALTIVFYGVAAGLINGFPGSAQTDEASGVPLLWSVLGLSEGVGLIVACVAIAGLVLIFQRVFAALVEKTAIASIQLEATMEADLPELAERHYTPIELPRKPYEMKAIQRLLYPDLGYPSTNRASS